MGETGMKADMKEANPGGNNKRIVVLCLSLVVGMTGLAYAAVPLYDLFCRVTGYGGTTQVSAGSQGIEIVDRDITVRFDANISSGLSWEFKPRVRDVTIKLGEQTQISYVARNVSDVPLSGTATFNVTPQSAGAYFNKIECFCFTETTLQPGEEIDMPVVFFVDPALIDAVETRDIKTITLSYTFFPDEDANRPLANLSKEKSGEDESKL